MYKFLELGEDEESPGKLPKKLFKVSQSGDSGSCKITISAHTPQSEKTDTNRKRKEFLSPSDESKIHVINNASPDFKKSSSPVSEKCSVSINFDMNTKKLWQDLHYPYGSYTSFFRHLILLEKYWRSGDLSLAPEAGMKAKSYLNSVKNRIKSYEERQYQSKDELSANTRPDLEQPAAPQLIHVPGEAVLANLPIGSPSPKLETIRSPEPSPNSTILRIPKVPQPRGSSAASESPVTSTPTPSAKIRVRQDLMSHLGLVAAKPKPPLVSSAPAPVSSHLSSQLTSQMSSQVSVSPAKTPVATTNHLRAALTVTPVAQSHNTPNLAKLLSDGPDDTPPDPVPLKSSNSQLFKSTESTGAIPLTFNNSIAEVLAAASKAAQNKSREPSPKPEITITAKSSNKTKDLSQVLAAANKTPVGGHKLPASITAPSPSGGGLSILKRAVAAPNPSVSAPGHSPLSNMTKLLQAQTPGLPPHIIAQQSLPAKTSSTKVMSRPPGPVMSNLRPVQISGAKPPAQGIQTVNKKSLNTVLDRLGGLGTTTTSSAKTTTSNLASSLVQQLQAPPMTSRPGPKSFKDSKGGNQTKPGNSSVSVSVSSSNIVPPIAQPMVQFPVDPTNLLSQSLLLGPNPAAAQAALMMAGLNGLTPGQAQQAMQELLQQQQQLMSSSQAQQQPRLRAPPPLKNMSAARKPD